MTTAPMFDRLDIESLQNAFTSIASTHGIEYVAIPEDDNEYSRALPIAENSASATCFVNPQSFALSTCDAEFAEPFSKPLNLLIYESYMTLIDAGMAEEDTAPPVTYNQGGICLDLSSTIPMSHLLLAFDRTISKLASIAAEHNFGDGKVISPLWLTRSLNEVMTSPEPSFKNNLSIALE